MYKAWIQTPKVQGNKNRLNKRVEYTGKSWVRNVGPGKYSCGEISEGNGLLYSMAGERLPWKEMLSIKD